MNYSTIDFQDGTLEIQCASDIGSGTVTLPSSAVVDLTSLDASTPQNIPLLRAAGGFPDSPSLVGWPLAQLGDAHYRAAITGNTLYMEYVPSGTLVSIR